MAKLISDSDVRALDSTNDTIYETSALKLAGPPIVSQPAWKWNEPKINISRLAATYWSFFLLGCNDSSYGFLIPHYEKYYHVEYITVSLLFLSPAAGYVISTVCNYPMHLSIGQRGVALVAGSCSIIAYIAICLHPPFPVLVVVYILTGMGNGAKAAAWNAFVGGLDQANEPLGLLHGFYGMGATLAPSIGTLLVTKCGWVWYEIFYIFIAMAVLDTVFSCLTFRHSSGRTYREKSKIVEVRRTDSARQADKHAGVKDRFGSFLTGIRKSRIVRCLRNRTVVLSSVYVLVYVGSEVSLGGWIVTFMVQVRHGSLFASGIVTSGFWAGITIGRVALGFVTGRLFKNPQHAVAVYLALAVVFELLFWLIPNFVVSAVALSFLGFFLGPVFPGVIVCLSTQLPEAMQVPGISTVSAIGASGASLIPFAVGAIAQAKGVQVLQPIILACLCLCVAIWMAMPGFRKRA